MRGQQPAIVGMIVLLSMGAASIGESACALNVYVEDPGGNPVESATVELTGAGSEMVRITDEYGEAIFNNLVEGWYYIVVSKDGVTVEDEVYVTDSKRRRHIVLLG